VIGRRIVLFVLTSWLAWPVWSLACAISCVPPAQVAASHCHEPSMNDGMAPDSGAAIRVGHRCADHAPLTVTAATVHRYAAQAPAMPLIVTVGAANNDNRELAGPFDSRLGGLATRSTDHSSPPITHRKPSG
jgi:hypothetical protein